MLRIVADLVEERGRGRDDLVHQELVGAIELQQRRQLVADFCADHRHGFRLGQRSVHRAQDIVEQPLMRGPRPRKLAACRRPAARDRLVCNWVVMRRDDEGHQARGFCRRNRLGQQVQGEAGEVRAALAVAQPVGNEAAEVDLAQLGIDGIGFEKMHLDEFAEFIGDAVLIALDDRGMRDRQSQRPAKQRHHRVPVGQPADGRGFRESRDEAENRMQRQQRSSRSRTAPASGASTSVASTLTRRSSAARAASPGASNERCLTWSCSGRSREMIQHRIPHPEERPIGRDARSTNG